MTLYLLKVHLQTFLSIPVTQKCQILSCDTLVANERYVAVNEYRTKQRGHRRTEMPGIITLLELKFLR